MKRKINKDTHPMEGGPAPVEVINLNHLLDSLAQSLAADNPVQAITAILLEELCTYLSVGSDTLSISYNERQCLEVLRDILRTEFRSQEEIMIFALRSLALTLEKSPITASKTFGEVGLPSDLSRLVEFGILNEPQLGEELLRILNVISQARPSFLKGKCTETICLSILASRGVLAHFGGSLRHSLVVLSRIFEASTERDWEAATTDGALSAFFTVFGVILAASPAQAPYSPVPGPTHLSNARVCVTQCCIIWSHACNAFGRGGTEASVPRFTYLFHKLLPMLGALLQMEDLVTTRMGLLCLAAASTCDPLTTARILYSKDPLARDLLGILRRSTVSHNASHKDFVHVFHCITQPVCSARAEHFEPVYAWGFCDRHVLDFNFTAAGTDFDTASQKVELDEQVSNKVEQLYKEYRVTHSGDKAKGKTDGPLPPMPCFTVLIRETHMGLGESECIRHLFRCPLPKRFTKRKVEGKACTCSAPKDNDVGPQTALAPVSCCGVLHNKLFGGRRKVAQEPPRYSLCRNNTVCTDEAIFDVLSIFSDVLNSSFINTVVRDALWALESVLMVLRDSHVVEIEESHVLQNAVLPALDAILSTGVPPFVVLHGTEIALTVEGDIVMRIVDCLRQLSAVCKKTRLWGLVLTRLRATLTIVQREMLSGSDSAEQAKAKESSPKDNGTSSSAKSVVPVTHCVVHPSSKEMVAVLIQRATLILAAWRTQSDNAAEQDAEADPAWLRNLLQVVPQCTDKECFLVRELERQVLSCGSYSLESITALHNHLTTTPCQHLRSQKCPGLLQWLLWRSVQRIPRVPEPPTLRSIFSIPGNVFWMSLRTHIALFERLQKPLRLICAMPPLTRSVLVYPFVTLGALSRYLTQTAAPNPVALVYDTDLSLDLTKEYAGLEKYCLMQELTQFEFTIDDVSLTDPTLTLLDVALHYSNAAVALRHQAAMSGRRTIANKIVSLLEEGVRMSYKSSVSIEKRVIMDTLQVPPLDPTARELTECLVKVMAMSQEESGDIEGRPLTTPEDARAFWTKLNYYTLQEVLHAAALMVYPSLQVILGGPGMTCLCYLSQFPSLFPLEARLQLFYQVVVKVPTDMIAAYPTVALVNHLTPTAMGHELLSSSPGRPLKHLRITVDREKLHEHAMVVLNHLGSVPLRLEIQFSGEAGTGEGPIKEFYHLLGRSCAARTELWHSGADVLFPRAKDPNIALGAAEVAEYRLVGRLLGKALQEKISLDIPLHAELFRALYGGLPVLSEGEEREIFRSIDPAVAASLDQLEKIADEAIYQSLDMHFTLPGDDAMQLCPSGQTIPVGTANVSLYTHLVRSFFTTRGVAAAMAHIREGFNDVVSLAHTQRFFTHRELQRMLCGDPDTSPVWSSAEAFLSSIQCDHGYTISSPAIVLLATCIADMTPVRQRDFLQFASGVRNLHPVYGLQPPLTVVQRACEGPPDSYLPTVNTCFHYLKLPPYSNLEVMRQKLITAAEEGQLAFPLS